MFTGSRCSLSRDAKELMDQKHPNEYYYYFDWDGQGFGVFLMGESTKASRTTSNKLPQIWVCARYVGGQLLQKAHFSLFKKQSMPVMSYCIYN